MGKEAFSFGENWLNYTRQLNKKRQQKATESLCELLGLESLEGKSFLDIGSGSGVFSLAAVELGARKVVSLDSDPKSIASCRQLKNKSRAECWIITEGSILDMELIQSLGTYDIVYSWGSLHHTGAMWKALENATRLVNCGGMLAIAIYNRTKTSTLWLKFKHFYNSSGKFRRKVLVWAILFPRILIRLIKLRHPLEEERGMSVYYDAIDWAGGLPYEFASFEEVCSRLSEKGFALKNSKRTRSTGCNEFLFRKTGKRCVVYAES